MKVTFKSSTNKAFEELIGKEMELTIDLCAHYTFDPEGCSFDFRHGTGRTSIITSYTSEEISMGCFEITINTYNSTYVFHNGEYDENKPALTKEEKQAISMSLIF